jgi:hypothetical protein
MKIGLLEISSRNHYVLLKSWIAVLKLLKYEIHVFTTKEIKTLIDESNVVYHIKRDNDPAKKFLKGVKNYTLDKLIITSVQSNLIDFHFFTPDYPFFITIHNAKTWFLGNRLNSLKNLIKRYIRFSIKRRSAGFFVNSKNMEEFIKDNTKYHKPIYIMPFSLYLKSNYYFKSSSSRIPLKKIVYPGMISATRKNYKVFFSLAEMFPDIEFLLLGSPALNPVENANIIINEIENKKLQNIRYFNKFISEEEYTKELTTAGCLFSDINISFTKEDYKEIYGLTKDSGISYLMINYCLPAILNHSFKNISELKNTTLKFKNFEEANDCLTKIYSDQTYHDNLLQKSASASMRFTPDLISKRIEKVINETS